MNTSELYTKFLECSSVSKDTRAIEHNAMYFALKGDNFDGNTFAQKALDNGAKYCIVDDPKLKDKHPNFIYVTNALESLQNLARFHRQQLNFPIIGLTGSNGKTTTKELIYAVLSQKYKVKATLGNLNNHIGVPLTILSFTQNEEFGIVEMGANHQKEIEFLSQIAQPDYGLITNFGKAHLEGFGGVEGVIKGKSELYANLKQNGKTVIINTDDELQLKQISDYDAVITFGSNETSDYVMTLKEANPFVGLRLKKVDIKSQLIGDYNFSNIAIACCIGLHFEIPIEKIKVGIENYKPDNNRSEIIKKGTINIILDAYNANPTSMKAALTNFNQIDAEKKYLFLGDMFELGSEAEIEHQNIASLAESLFLNNIFLVGENFFNTVTKTSTKKYKTFDDLKIELENMELKKSHVLIKGSRGMALERILELI